MKDPVPVEYLSHEEKYAAELKKACLLVQILQKPIPEGGSEILRYFSLASLPLYCQFSNVYQFNNCAKALTKCPSFTLSISPLPSHLVISTIFSFRKRQQLGKPVELSVGTSASVLKEGNALGLHFVMFMPAIMGQGTKEQQQKWLPRAQKLQIIGTYAQVSI